MRPLVVLTALLLHAQPRLSPDLDALTKIRTRMIFNLGHQPNYTCVETIERSRRAKTTNKLKVIDMLRLEVALVDGKEMFAWPGSRKFQDSDITKMVTTGAIGNGNFGTHARALFTTRAATFKYLGEVAFQGQQAIRFDFNVPQMLSGYSLRIGTATAIVGFHGSFYADPQTFDMKRIEVLADEIPPELLLSHSSDKIDYAVTRIGEGDFLLPTQSELSMVDLNGAESHNQVKFTACRQFSGESTISFDDAPMDKKEAPPTREFELPAGVEIPLELTESLDLVKIAVGDPVHARVPFNIKHKGVLLIPKDAKATGRLTRLERYDTHTIIGMEFPEIEAPGILARMKGGLDHTVGIAPVRARITLRGRTPLGVGEGVFATVPSQLRIARGCIMYWRS